MNGERVLRGIHIFLIVVVLALSAVLFTEARPSWLEWTYEDCVIHHTKKALHPTAVGIIMEMCRRKHNVE